MGLGIRQAGIWCGAVTENLRHNHNAERKTQLGMFEASKPTPGDTSPLTRPHLLNFSKWSNNLGPSIHIYEPIGTVLIQNPSFFQGSGITVEDVTSMVNEFKETVYWSQSGSCFHRYIVCVAGLRICARPGSVERRARHDHSPLAEELLATDSIWKS